MDQYLDISCSLRPKRQAIFLERNRRRAVAANSILQQRCPVQISEDLKAEGAFNTQETTAGKFNYGSQKKGKISEKDAESDEPQPFLQDPKFIKIKDFELHNIVTELNDLTLGAIQVECNLSVFSVIPTMIVGRQNKLGNELIKLSRKGTIRNRFVRSGKSGIITRINFPDEFLIPLEELNRAANHAVSQNGVPDQNVSSNKTADEYGLKIVLSILGDRQDLQPLGAVGQGIARLRQDGQTKNVQIMCKGNLSSEPESRLNMKILLSTDCKIRKTEYRLQAQVLWGLALQKEVPIPHLPQNVAGDLRSGVSPVEKVKDGRARNSNATYPLAETQTPRNKTTTRKPHTTSILESPPHPIRLPLILPQIQRRIFHHDTKQPLTPGDTYTAYDHSADLPWRIRKIEVEIQSNTHISDIAKDYLTRWITFAFPLRISSTIYTSPALQRFVHANQIWFSESESRRREFGLHATVLRLRGFLTLGDLLGCIRLFRGEGGGWRWSIGAALGGGA